MKPARACLLFIFLNILAVLFLTGQSYPQSLYPLIPSLSSTDPVFRQYSEDVLEGRKALALGGKGSYPVNLYAYRVRENDTLLAIAARCAIPYDAIATLNRISSMTEKITGRILVLPTLPGLYLPEEADSSIETLLFSSFDLEADRAVSFTLRERRQDGTVSARTVHCIPGAVFNGTVRNFFLVPYFRFPLPEGRYTSAFGMRKSPITGQNIFHKGIDIAAPEGTTVYACADGIVRISDSNPVYGNYIILTHSEGRESLYGHLQTKKSSCIKK
ncbi:LysM peptidoglycan-binding domain-containing M23 family metallopeptidase [Brucepastera parasyntrophica]|uniref:LysM peptidoglycan-binding domain-containing M23 family metallopeptidase n=1 Tax=Brucepastera parasyntrophica TaxID=2880008 RepID=UPI0034E29380